MSNQKYWVASNGDAPDAMFFNEETAFANESNYLDVFDAEGNKVEAWMRTVDCHGKTVYTKDF